jgi:hypothetical protein
VLWCAAQASFSILNTRLNNFNIMQREVPDPDNSSSVEGRVSIFSSYSPCRGAGRRRWR